MVRQFHKALIVVCKISSNSTLPTIILLNWFHSPTTLFNPPQSPHSWSNDWILKLAQPYVANSLLPHQLGLLGRCSPSAKVDHPMEPRCPTTDDPCPAGDWPGFESMSSSGCYCSICLLLLAGVLHTLFQHTTDFRLLSVHPWSTVRLWKAWN